MTRGWIVVVEDVWFSEEESNAMVDVYGGCRTGTKDSRTSPREEALSSSNCPVQAKAKTPWEGNGTDKESRPRRESR